MFRIEILKKSNFSKIFLNFGPAQLGPSILNLAQAWFGPKVNIGLGPCQEQAMISLSLFRPGPKKFGPNSSLAQRSNYEGEKLRF